MVSRISDKVIANVNDVYPLNVISKSAYISGYVAGK